MTFCRTQRDVSIPTIKEYYKGTFSGLSCESVTLFLSAGAHRHSFIYEIHINKDVSVHQPATAAGLLTQATVEGCKLYSITSDLDVHTEDLAEEKITKSMREKKNN